MRIIVCNAKRIIVSNAKRITEWKMENVLRFFLIHNVCIIIATTASALYAEVDLTWMTESVIITTYPIAP
jgi:hypothetical protein